MYCLHLNTVSGPNVIPNKRRATLYICIVGCVDGITNFRALTHIQVHHGEYRPQHVLMPVVFPSQILLAGALSYLGPTGGRRDGHPASCLRMSAPRTRSRFVDVRDQTCGPCLVLVRNDAFQLKLIPNAYAKLSFTPINPIVSILIQLRKAYTALISILDY